MTTLLRPSTTTVADAPEAPSVADRPVRRRRVSLITVGCLLLVVGIVQGTNIAHWPAIGADEGTYLAQAWAVAAGRGLANYTYWYDHPPLGWVQLSLLSWLPQRLWSELLTVAAARYVMLLVSLINCALLYLVGRRLELPRWACALAVSLFALCPLSIALHRQIFLDSFAVLWLLVTLALVLAPRRHLWHFNAAGCALAISVLSKETMALALPAVLVALWRGTHSSTRKFCVVGFGCCFILTTLFYPLYALLKGELLPGEGHVSLLGAFQYQLTARAGSGSLFSSDSAASQVLRSWLYHDQVLIIGGMAASVAAVWTRRLRVPAVAVLVMALTALRPNGYLPAMYIAQMLPFLALCLAGIAAVVVRWVLTAYRDRLALPWARWSLVAVLAFVPTVLVAPGWAAAGEQAMTVRTNDRQQEAVRWLAATVTDRAGTRVVVDDGLWLDLVRLGFRPGTGVIWFYKLDLDPAVTRALPGGWRDLDYIVAGPIIRDRPDTLPTLRDAFAHSSPVAVFGDGADRVEILKINK